MLPVTVTVLVVVNMQLRPHALWRDDTESDKIIRCKPNIFTSSPRLCAANWAVSCCHLLRLYNSFMFPLYELYFGELYLVSVCSSSLSLCLDISLMSFSVWVFQYDFSQVCVSFFDSRVCTIPTIRPLLRLRLSWMASTWSWTIDWQSTLWLSTHWRDSISILR